MFLARRDVGQFYPTDHCWKSCFSMPSLGTWLRTALAGLCFLRIGGDADHLCNLVRGTLQHQLLEVWGPWLELGPHFFGSNVGFSAEKGRPSTENKGNGYGSIPINTIFRGMNIHLPAILMFTRGTRFWHTAKWKHCPGQNQQRLQQTGPDSWECRLPWWASEVLKYSQVRRHI